MKKQLFISTLLTSSLLLTGCFSKSISAEEFKTALNDVKTYVNGEFASGDMNCHINDDLQYTYDFKEGEFFRYNSFALLIIVPITELECTWTKDGKYYHYVKYSANEKKNKDEEITKAEFDALMLVHKATMLTQLNRPITSTETYMSDENTESTYSYNSSSKTYSINAVVKYTVEMYEDGSMTSVEKQETNNISFKNNLPTQWKIKVDGKKTWKYSYGNAKFTNPKDNN